MATQKKPLARLACLAQAATVMLVAVVWLEAGQASKLARKLAEKSDTARSAARQQILGARPLRMYYYLDDSRGLKSLNEHAAEMTLLGPQCFWVDAEGFVHGGAPSGVLEIARSTRLPVMPLLINPGFDRPTASAMLRSSKAQERAVTYLAYLAKRDNYAGWQLNLERIDPADKHLYTRFVRRAAARLHRDGRLVSIAVVPRFSDQYPDNRPAEFRTGEWGAPYDFRTLGQVVDFLVLMTYDQHTNATPPGPVAGHAWMKQALEYALARVPRRKLLLGIPFYGREWVETADGTLSRAMTYDDLSPLLARPGVEVQWDERWRTPWFQYREAQQFHTVWFDDSRSFREKLQLVRLYRLKGFAAWRLGTEDPQFWSVAAAIGKGQSAGPSQGPGKPLVRQNRRPRGPASERSRPKGR